MKKLFALLSFLIPTILFAQNIHTYIQDQGGKTYNTRFPIVRQYYPAGGIRSTTTLTNFPYTSIDSTQIYITSVNPFPSGGTKYGGIGWAGPVAGTDSVQVTAPFGILCGSSFSASHGSPLSFFSRLEGTSGNGGAIFQYNYIDSIGTFAYYMRQLTNYRWYPQAVGGQTTHQMRERWARDVLGQSINGTLDGRGATTISRKPYIVFFDGIGNDPYGVNASPLQTEQDLIYMAQSCKENGIFFICCISTTTAGVSVAGDQFVQAVNKWIEAGGLDPYGAVIFDMRHFWSNPATGYNGVIGNPNYVNQSDFTHYQIPKNSGQSAGYDSLAIAVVTQCHVPILTKIVFNTNNDPTHGLSQVNYITAAAIDQQAYSGLTQNDTFPILQPLGNGYGGATGAAYNSGDSVWIRPTAVTSLTGSGNNYYLGYVAWFMDNTAGMTSDDTAREITHRTPRMTAGSGTNIDISTMVIHPETNNSGDTDIYVYNPTWSGPAFVVYGGTINHVLINGAAWDAASTLMTNGTVNAGTGIFKSAGTAGSQLGDLIVGDETGSPAFANAVGTQGSSPFYLYFMSSGQSVNQPIFSFRSDYGTAPFISGTSLDVGEWEDSTGFSTNSGTSDSTLKVLFKMPITDTVTNHSSNWMGGIRLQYKVANLGVNRLFSYISNRGDNIFNYEGERTGFGTITIDPSAVVDIEDTARGILLPQWTTAQRNNIGGISIAKTAGGSGYSTDPKVVISGGSGKNARFVANTTSGAVTGFTAVDAGEYYGGSLPTVTLANTSGTGATWTVSLLAPKDGLIGYNTSVDSFQYYRAASSAWVDLGGDGNGIYSGSGSIPSGGSTVNLNGNKLAFSNLTGPPSTYAAIVHSTASDSGTYQVNLASGTYTPTFTNVGNVASFTAEPASYIIIGKIVHVSINCFLTPTSNNAQTIFTFSLPVTSSASNPYGGIMQYLATGANTASAEVGFVLMNSTTTATCTFYYNGGTPGSQPLTIQFDYSL